MVRDAGLCPPAELYHSRGCRDGKHRKWIFPPLRRLQGPFLVEGLCYGISILIPINLGRSVGLQLPWVLSIVTLTCRFAT
jgi:hypothetical protein